MKQCLMLAGLLIAVLSGCHAPEKKAPAPVAEDSSLIAVQEDTMVTSMADSVAVITADTQHYETAQLVGKWLQLVTGPDKPVMQGFQLKKNGTMVSINTYSLVYEKWALMHDTLLLWSQAEGMKTKDSSAIIDTTIIRQLTDTSLVLFPIKAAEGYLERYKKKL